MAYRGPDPKPESVTATESLSGSDVKIEATNTSDTASSSATIKATVAGTSAGDAVHTVAIDGGEQFSWGIDNSDSDKFKLSDSATLGTNDVLEVNSSQILTTTKASYAGSGRINSVSSANYTITDTDGYDTILVTTGASDRTITLPTAADNTGRVLNIKKVDSGAGKVIVDGEGSETIGSNTVFDVIFQHDFVEVMCDGTGWQILNYNAISKWFSETVTITGSSSNPSKGTVDNDVIYWRRVGNNMEFKFQYNQTAAGSAGSGYYQIVIPNSLTIDTNFITAAFAFVPIGSMRAKSGGSSFYIGVLNYNNTTSLYGTLTTGGVAVTDWGASFIPLSTTSMGMGGEGSVPILEWVNSIPG